MRVNLTGFGIVVLAVGAAAQTVTGSGTSNTVPVFTGSSTIGNSPVSVSGSNVGIGTTSPNWTLQVNGTLMSGAPGTTQGVIGIAPPNGESWFCIDNPGASGNYLRISNGGAPGGSGASGSVVISASGYVGIGTTNPGSSLDVNGKIQTSQLNSGFAAMTLGDKLATPGNKGWLARAEADSSPWQGVADSLDFEYWNGTNAITPFTISAAGNVGIGTTNPSQKLEVAGYIQVDNGVYFPGSSTPQTTPWTGVLCGGDYAEAVEAAGTRKAYEPGDVLVIAEGADGDVKKSSEPYSTTVAGIFATKPGVVGRRESLPKDGDEVPMAMIGIVPTKATTENGPIRKGDLLVTSSKDGYDMKGTDRSRMLGAVIGKAMGTLDSGTGVLEVLVTLQ